MPRSTAPSLGADADPDAHGGLELPIGGFRPVSLVDFPARVAAVVFVQGCNFRCPWCHNPDLVLPSRFGTPLARTAVLAHLEARRGRISGVVVTGGEPTLQPGLASFLEEVRRMGLATKLDTNGSRPEIVADLRERGLLDFVAMDLKAPWDRYDEACGVPVDLDGIRQTMSILRSSGIPHHLRTTDWAGFSPEERREIGRAAEDTELRWQECRC